MFPRLPARATFVADTNFVSGTQKCFYFCSETFCVRNKCFPVCTRKETSWATMFPQQCVLVCHRLKNATDRNIVERNMLKAFGHPIATCCDMLRAENRTSAHTWAQHCCTNLAKRLQHHATSINVAWKIWPFSSPGQTIAAYQHNISQHYWPSICKITTFQHNISQHCWAQHVECVWPPCCNVSGIENRTIAHALVQTLLHEPGQTTTTSCNIQKRYMKNLTIFKFEPTTPNMSQHRATGWPNTRNMLHPIMLRYVAKCDRLAGALSQHSHSTDRNIVACATCSRLVTLL